MNKGLESRRVARDNELEGDSAEAWQGLGESASSQGITSAWEDLAEVDFVDDTRDGIEVQKEQLDPEEAKRRMVSAPWIALGTEKADTSEPLVSAGLNLEDEPIERQAEMRRDFAALETLRIDLGSSENGVEERAVIRDQFLRKKAEITKRRLAEPDCIEYLMEVTGDPIEAVTMDMFLVDPGRTLRHFGHMSELLEDNFGDNANQAAYNMLQYAVLGEDLLKMNNRDKACQLLPPEKDFDFEGVFQMPKAEDYRNMLSLAKRYNLEADKHMADKYAEIASGSNDTDVRDQLIDDLDVLGNQGVEPGIVSEWLCRNGHFDDLMERGEDFANHDIDVRNKVQSFIREAISTPEDVAMKVLRNPEAYQKYGVDVKRVLENNLPQAWIFVALDVRSDPARFEAFGLDLDQIEADSKAYYKEMAMGNQPGFEGDSFSYEDCPPEVKEDYRHNYNNTIEREEAYLGTVLYDFAAQNWSHKNSKERKATINNFARTMAKIYKINRPFEVGIFPDEHFRSGESNPANTTFGQHSTQYYLARDPAMAEYRQKLQTWGVEATWLPYSVVKINEVCLANGAKCVETISHEMRHMFQGEQAFMYRMGYYDEAKEGATNDDLDYLPNLAKFYSANLQDKCYHKSKNSYDAYRQQLVENDAFSYGAKYKEAVMSATEQIKRQTAGQSKEENGAN